MSQIRACYDRLTNQFYFNHHRSADGTSLYAAAKLFGCTAMPAIKSCSESADFKGLQLIIQPDTYGNLDVDYSKARKGPQIMAAMAGKMHFNR